MIMSPTCSTAVFSQKHILLAILFFLIVTRAQSSPFSRISQDESMDHHQHQHQHHHHHGYRLRHRASWGLHNYVIHMQRYQLHNPPPARNPPQGENQDPSSSSSRFVADKRLVPTGPNPLHN